MKTARREVNSLRAKGLPAANRLYARLRAPLCGAPGQRHQDSSILSSASSLPLTLLNSSSS